MEDFMAEQTDVGMLATNRLVVPEGQRVQIYVRADFNRGARMLVDLVGPCVISTVEVAAKDS
jgi:hypothetical protein